MHRDSIVIPVLCGLLLGVGGCNQGSPPSSEADSGTASTETTARLSGVAVVDLDEVARQLGRDVSLAKSIRDGQVTLNRQLRDFQTTLKESYREKAEKLNAEPASAPGAEEARQKQLAELQRQLNLQLGEAQRTAQNELKAHQKRLIEQFRSEVKPVARDVAAQRGLGVVVTKNETVLLTFDDAHDITQAVVAKLRAAPSASGGPAASVASRPPSPSTAPRR